MDRQPHRLPSRTSKHPPRPSFVICSLHLGNAWKYWYLQQDPARLSPHYRYFKDPNTQPQQHIIYGLAIIIGLTVPPPLLVYALMTDLLYLPEKVAAWTASILALGILLWGLARIVAGIVQLIRRALRRRPDSPKA